jgi:putative ABC transport system permease protein
MHVRDIISTANSNLRRSKLRTFLTVFSIVIGAFTLAMSIGLGEGIKGYINSQIGSQSGTNSYRVTKQGADSLAGGSFSSPEPKEYDPNAKIAIRDFTQALLSKEDIQRASDTPGVEGVYKPYSVETEYLMGADGKKYTAPADVVIPQVKKTYVAGRELTESAENEVLLSNKYLTTIGAKNSQDAVGKEIIVTFKKLDGTLFSRALNVVGVITPSIFDQVININVATAKSIAYEQKGELAENFAVIFVSKSDSVSEETMKANLLSVKLEAKSIKDAIGTLDKVITGAQIGLGAFSGIAILSAVVGVINTLYMAVLERTREIGLYRSLGAKRKTVFALFSVEACLIGFWGSVVGLIVANFASLAVNKVAANTFLKGVDGYQLLKLPVKLQLSIMGIVILVTLMAGLLPARKASKLDPIQALRTE